MEKIIVIGGGGHAKSVIAVVKKIKSFKVSGYVDKEDRGKILGIKYLGTDESLKEILKKNPRCSAVLGIGYVEIGEKRRLILEAIKKLGFKLPAVISPQAIMNEEVTIEEGAIVHDGAIINAGTKIGKGAIINNGVIIDHDCVIGNFSQIAPGAVLNGGVHVGDYSIIGTGANVIQYRHVGAKCFIAAGAVVVNDCPGPGMYLGIPARKR